MKRFAIILLVTAWGLALSPAAFAGGSPFFRGEVQGKPAEHGLPKNVQHVGIDQHLGDQVTLNLPVRDENGNSTTLASFFGQRPIILVMAYYECPNLCTMVMNGVFSAMKPLPFIPGKDFDVISVSINPHETPALAKQKKQSYLEGYHQADHADGYHFLTADETTIEQLCKEVGFRYSYDSETHQYAHASGIMLLTPEGKLSRYFFGVQFAPNDVKYGLMDASGGKIGSLADKLVLYCYHYDPSSSKYGLAITNILRIGGVITLLAIGIMFYVFRRRSKAAVGLTARDDRPSTLQIRNA